MLDFRLIGYKIKFYNKNQKTCQYFRILKFLNKSFVKIYKTKFNPIVNSY